jgi:hypothetical protein
MKHLICYSINLNLFYLRPFEDYKDEWDEADLYYDKDDYWSQ